MTSVCDVLPQHRQALAGVTHADGTARVQTVGANANSLLFRVLSSLERRTNVPVVLNTSLNGPGEPIVAHATDALGFLSAHAIDGLVIEDCLFRRRA
jgi:carbamoyltransferase